MINLLLRTEYTFQKVFGPIEKVVAAAEGDACGIADNNTFGHVAFFNECVKQKKKPLLGVRLIVGGNKDHKPEMSFIAKNNDGLAELYRLSSLANKQGSLTHDNVLDAAISDNLVMFNGMVLDEGFLRKLKKVYLDVNPHSAVAINAKMALAERLHLPLVATSDNRYPTRDHREVYELMGTRPALTPEHIMSERDMRRVMPMLPDEAYTNSDIIAKLCTVELPHAANIKVEGDIEAMCRAGIRSRFQNGLKDRWSPDYEDRLVRELAVIREKKFEDYFVVIADMVQHAKRSMLVGPGRGSSAGSLVCYLLGITDVDPLRFGLLFERFVDVTRTDLPDIDLDFPDTTRESVLQYLREKYGDDRVAHIATVSRYQPKSVLNDVGKALGIPPWDFKDVKAVLIERNSDDEGAERCLADTLTTTDAGKAVLAKHPGIALATELEGHARHAGVHAAGIIICNKAISNYCTVTSEGVAQIDKKDAEKINLLKIDALGLRTLSVISDTLDIVAFDPTVPEATLDLNSIPLDDPKVYDVFKQRKYAGVFQFEGSALQNVTNEMGCDKFDDIVALTSLCRPGPMNGGGTRLFVLRRTGQEKPIYAHPLVEKITKSTYGVIVYQEQVMQIAREVGKMSWPEVSRLRKAMGKSMGDEYMEQFWIQFRDGAKENGVEEAIARRIWNEIRTFGSYGFNLSHAVAYSLISYWCAWLKVYHPVAFACGCLRNAKDDEQTIALLRELVSEGHTYIPFDRERSQLNWSVQDGKLYGGMMGIRGVGQSKAQALIDARKDGKLTPQQEEMLAKPDIFYADVFQTKTKFADWYEHPDAHGIDGKISHSNECKEPGEYVVIGKLITKELRDMNSYEAVLKRGGKTFKKDVEYMMLTLEDDAGIFKVMIGRFDYQRLGVQINIGVEPGAWLMVRGTVKSGFNMLTASKIKVMQ
jgi:DNA-directed DNA polymerase III PolC